MWLVAVVMLTTAAPDRLYSVAIDFASLDRRSYDAMAASGLYKSLLVRLVDEHVALVSTAATADIVVHFLRDTSHDDSPMHIVVESAAGTLEKAIDVQRPRDSQTQRAFILAVLTLVRQACGDLARAEPTTVHDVPETLSEESPIAPPSRTGVAIETHDEANVSLSHEIYVIADISSLWDASHPGLLVDVGASMRVVGPLQLEVGAMWHEPREQPASLSVWEWGAYGGGRIARPVLTSRLVAYATLDIGIWQQRYRYDDNAIVDKGSRWDPMALGRLGLAFAMTRAVQIGIQIGCLATLHDRRHQVAGETLWRAPGLRPFAGLGAAWGW